MKRNLKYLLLSFVLVLSMLTGCVSPVEETEEAGYEETVITEDTTEENDGIDVEEDGEYTSKEEVALYIYEFGHLPDNFITKKDPYKNYDLQKMKEMACARDGHLWTKFEDPNKKLKDRVYCRRCGQMYHEHTYIGTQE